MMLSTDVHDVGHVEPSHVTPPRRWEADAANNRMSVTAATAPVKGRVCPQPEFVPASQPRETP
mgnify:CR=1 FL=1